MATQHDRRLNHIKKVAYFVKHKNKEPIHLQLDSKDYNSHIISDGNHRLAGRYIAGDDCIKAEIFGDIQYAKDIYFFNPNKYEIELEKRHTIQIQELELKKINKKNINKL
jgi:hypothetical protein